MEDIQKVGIIFVIVCFIASISLFYKAYKNTENKNRRNKRILLAVTAIIIAILLGGFMITLLADNPANKLLSYSF